MFAVDVDPRHGGDLSLDELIAQHGPLPDSIESHTGGGGRHLLFRWPGRPVKCSTGQIAPGIDVKGDGGYIIVPPSSHKSGHAYCWELSSEPGNAELSRAPAWLLQMIESPSTAARPDDRPTASCSDDIPEGYRNRTLASQAGSMRQVGFTAQEIEAALLAVNIDRCKPPLEASEVRSIGRRVGRYDPDVLRQSQIEHWPERYLGDRGSNDAAPLIGPVLTCLADVEPRDVEWLWPRRIAIGKITMLAGDPGLGKSFCCTDIAARISAGLPWPDLPDRSQLGGGVIILSAEDALDDTIRPRLDAAGADPERVTALLAVRDIDPKTGLPRQRGFHLDKDMENLELALRRTPGCRLVIIDPISSYLGDANSHNNAEVRGLLAPLSDLAARHRVAVLCVSHLNKGAGDAMYRVMGSLAFVAAARAAYVVVKDSKDDTGQRRLVLPIKNNLGDDESGLAYSIVESSGNAQPRVQWEPELVHMTVKEALGIADGNGETFRRANNDDGCHRSTQIAEASEWLECHLAEGPKPARAVILAAAKDGISKRTLERAKASNPAIVAKREGLLDGGSHWVWLRINTDALLEQVKTAN